MHGGLCERVSHFSAGTQPSGFCGKRNGLRKALGACPYRRKASSYNICATERRTSNNRSGGDKKWQAFGTVWTARPGDSKNRELRVRWFHQGFPDHSSRCHRPPVWHRGSRTVEILVANPSIHNIEVHNPRNLAERFCRS